MFARLSNNVKCLPSTVAKNCTTFCINSCSSSSKVSHSSPNCVFSPNTFPIPSIAPSYNFTIFPASFVPIFTCNPAISAKHFIVTFRVSRASKNRVHIVSINSVSNIYPTGIQLKNLNNVSNVAFTNDACIAVCITSLHNSNIELNSPRNCVFISCAFLLVICSSEKSNISSLNNRNISIFSGINVGQFCGHSCFSISTNIKFSFDKYILFSLICPSELDIFIIIDTIKFLIPVCCSPGNIFHRVCMIFSKICNPINLVCAILDFSNIVSTRVHASRFS
ncbi:hypothetical protein AX774_g1319 [Zancudomyces culisetae]|uniref:Uncharacterized protein n=1 Tax=Zancudomyces culisetae TaxID=1213189 RepID=A0A1R1PW38_ZANCU|nr:hypothetical protein AX774_g1319 [Zancudomyces culisetae]|eukprot:OMH85134.1 hypothetical protein AX774_g1319 [Zancudomyces culisetae]